MPDPLVQEKVVEKIVNVEKEVIKEIEVIKEVPVNVEVEKIVYVDKIIENKPDIIQPNNDQMILNL